MNTAQCKRNYSSSEKASEAETVQPTTELEKKLLTEVESLTNQSKTLEEKNNDLLVSLTIIWCFLFHFVFHSIFVFFFSWIIG